VAVVEIQNVDGEKDDHREPQGFVWGLLRQGWSMLAQEVLSDGTLKVFRVQMEAHSVKLVVRHNWSAHLALLALNRKEARPGPLSFPLICRRLANNDGWP